MPEQARFCLLLCSVASWSVRTEKIWLRVFAPAVYRDWQTDGIEFVRGKYGSSEGHSSVVLERRGDRLVHIAETFNRPGAPLDARTEIRAVQQQLGIPADEPRCRVASAQGGTCNTLRRT